MLLFPISSRLLFLSPMPLNCTLLTFRSYCPFAGMIPLHFCPLKTDPFFKEWLQYCPHELSETSDLKDLESLILNFCGTMPCFSSFSYLLRYLSSPCFVSRNTVRDSGDTRTRWPSRVHKRQRHIHNEDHVQNGVCAHMREGREDSRPVVSHSLRPQGL